MTTDELREEVSELTHRAIELAGSVSSVASDLGVALITVMNWRDRKSVPKTRGLNILRAYVELKLGKIPSNPESRFNKMGRSEFKRIFFKTRLEKMRGKAQ